MFLNLAVPSMLASEPGDLNKIELVEGLEVNLWDRWELKDLGDKTLQEMITMLEDRYAGLEVRDVMKGGQPIFFHAIMSTPGKETEKKALLEQKIFKLCEADSEDTYLDISITCVAKGSDTILEGVPPLRIYA